MTIPLTSIPISGTIFLAVLSLAAFSSARAQRIRQDTAPSQTAPARAYATQSDCQLESGGESTVVGIAGPQTLRLADGRFVRLVEVLAPSQLTPPTGFDPSGAAASYLRETALGRKVEVRYGGTRRDRYGVYLAHVFVMDEPKVWLQEGLVRRGLAEAYPQPDNRACASRLIEWEANARGDRLGYWGLSLFKILPASDAQAIVNLTQTYQIVEGRVKSVNETGSRVALVFGPDANRSFTAVLEPALKKKFERERNGSEFQSWAGTILRIRGWIESRRGPSISIRLPEQIQFVRETEPAPRDNSEGK